MDLLQYTASLPGGTGQWNSCNTLPHCLGAVGRGPPAIHCPTAWGQWVVDLLQYTAPMPGGSGQWNSCNTLPHCLGAVGSGPPAIHCLTAWGQWAGDLLQYTASLPGGSGQWVVDFLQCTASLPGGSGHWTSSNTLPHCPRQAGPTPPATRPGLLPGPEVQPVRGRCTAATHSAPARYLVAWHQDKNPQDGSCGTGCPQAQPGNGPVFTHSLTHSPTHSLARSLTRVSPGPTPATPRGHPPRENGAVP